LGQANLEALLERLQTTKSIEELQVWAHELRDHFGVTHVMYHTATLKREQVGAFTYGLEWARRYIEKDYRSIDPVVLGAVRRFHPMDWKTLDWSSPAAREMMREAMAAGLGNQGWSIPIWGPQGEFALFAINHATDDESWAAFTARHAKDLLLVSHLMHQQAMRIVNDELEPPSAELSPRERETLLRLSFGHSRAAVAADLHISENTLRAYIDSARHKLGALNVTHAVALALARGIIVPAGALPKY
jgi:DNA-binding CsgD family transcriptional regulator